MKLAFSFCLAFLLAGCVFYDSIEPKQLDMTGCVPSPACMLDGGVEPDMAGCTGCADMHVSEGDIGMCIMLCPNPPDMTTVDMTPMCSPATAATDCTNAMKPICGSGGICRACQSPTDDTACGTRSTSTPRCMPSGTSAGECVACVPSSPLGQSANCSTATAPICTALGTCRACQSHAECASGICIFDGAAAGGCAPSAMVALVDNGNAVVATCQAGRPTRNGNTAATAYCDVSEAVTDGRPYVFVKGSGQPYGAITLTDHTITIVGPGATASPTARLFTVAMASVSLSVGSGSHPTVLDGLDLGGDSFMKALRGVGCNNSTGTAANANLVIRNSRAHDSTMEGLLATSCASTLDANTFTTNTGGGVSISGGSITMVNNFVVDNGTSGPGVVLAGNLSSSLFWFNTIANNLRTGGQVGGINCAGVLSGAPVIQASIINGNTMAGGASVVGCNVNYSDIDDTTAPTGIGNFSQAPLFVASGYHLQAGSPCKDKITAGTGLTGGTLPTHDIDGDPRPRASTGGDDVGADQIVP